MAAAQGLGFVPYVGDLDVELAKAAKGGGGATLTISDTEPENPPTGSMWFDWSAPRLSLRYDHETWIELAPNMETPTGPPLPPPGPQPPTPPGPGPTPTPPWEMTYAFPGNRVTFANDPTGQIPLTTWTGWDNDFRADLNDQALYLGPNAPANPAAQVVRLFATYTPPGTEVEVEFDKFTLGTSTGNHITVWGFDNGSDSIYIQGNNATGNPIQLRLEKT